MSKGQIWLMNHHPIVFFKGLMGIPGGDGNQVAGNVFREMVFSKRSNPYESLPPVDISGGHKSEASAGYKKRHHEASAEYTGDEQIDEDSEDMSPNSPDLDSDHPLPGFGGKIDHLPEGHGTWIIPWAVEVDEDNKLYVRPDLEGSD